MKHFVETNPDILINLINNLVGELFVKTVGHTIEYIKFSEILGYFDKDLNKFFISKEYLK